MTLMPTGAKKLTLAQAAGICGVSRVTMWRWVKSSDLSSATTAGGHHRVRPDDLAEFMKQKNMDNHVRSTSQRKRILVVDDDPHIQKLLIKWLSRKGYEVAVCSNGFEAGIQVMKFRPQLVILDLFMPQLDGFEVCRLIKNDPATAPIKILAISGTAYASNIQKITDCGADLFLKKPLDLNRLLEMTHNLITIPLLQDAI